MLIKYVGVKIFLVFFCDEKVFNYYKVFYFNWKKNDIFKILNSKDIKIL